MTAFGPWTSNLDAPERRARIRSMRAIALLLARPHRQLISALAAAESDPAALERAAGLLEGLPSLTRRRVLASYAKLSEPVR